MIFTAIYPAAKIGHNPENLNILQRVLSVWNVLILQSLWSEKKWEKLCEDYKSQGLEEYPAWYQPYLPPHVQVLCPYCHHCLFQRSSRTREMSIITDSILIQLGLVLKSTLNGYLETHFEIKHLWSNCLFNCFPPAVWPTDCLLRGCL